MQRVNEFPGEMLTNATGRLFCSVCREELSLKLSIIKSHVELAKHATNKQQLKKKQSKQHDCEDFTLKINEHHINL